MVGVATPILHVGSQVSGCRLQWLLMESGLLAVCCIIGPEIGFPLVQLEVQQVAKLCHEPQADSRILGGAGGQFKVIYI